MLIQSKTYSVDEWQTAAVAAFRATLSELRGTPVDNIHISLHGDPHTAKVMFRETYNGNLYVELFLPVFLPGKRFTKSQADVLAGYWLHELGHVLLTDIDAFVQCGRDRGAAFARCVNGLEDPRMERGVSDRLGDHANELFAALADHDWTPNSAANAADPRNLPWVFAYLGRAALGCPVQHAAEMRAALPASTLPLVDYALAELPNARSVQDVIKIVDALFDGIDADDISGTDGPGEAGEAGEAGESKGDDAGEAGEAGESKGDDAGEAGEAGESKGDGDDAGDGESKGDDGDGESKGDDGDGESKGDDAGDGESKGDDADAGKGRTSRGGKGEAKLPFRPDDESVNDAEPNPAGIADDVNGTEVGTYARSALTEARQTRTRDVDFDTTRNRSRSFATLKAKAGDVFALRAAVRQIVRSPERFGWNKHQEDGRFDPLGSVRSRMGRRDVFRHVDESQAEVAAVTLLVDGSSSMTGANCTSAAALAANLAEAIEGAGAPVAVVGFQDNFRGVTLDVFKSFKQRVRQRHGAFVRATRYANGGTPLAPAMIVASNAMLAQNPNATRHILIALTDGGDAYGAQRVHAATAMCQQLGVEIIGLGLGMSEAYIGGTFENADAWAAAEGGTLTGEALKALAKQLAKGRTTKGENDAIAA